MAIQTLSFPWASGDQLPATPPSDEEAIRQSIHQILLVQRGERVYRPTVGSALKRFLFEGATPVVANLIREEIRQSLRAQERRIQIRDIQVRFVGNEANVTLIYARTGVQQTLSMRVPML